MLITAIQLLTKSLNLYKKHLGRYITYSILLLLPTILLNIAGMSLGILLIITKSVFTGITIFILLVITLSLLGFIMSLAFIRMISDDYMMNPYQSISTLLKHIIPLTIPALLISLLTSLAIFFGMFLLIIPGIIFALWFSFSIHALILDDTYSLDALKYSQSLVTRRWFGVLWRMFAPLFIVFILFSLIQWISASLLGIQNNSEFQFTISQITYLIINAILIVLATPLTILIPTILYIELKKTPMIKPIEDTPINENI